MWRAICILVAIALTACEKRAPDLPVKTEDCTDNLTIINVNTERNTTVLEQFKDGKNYRFETNGVLGKPGDSFSIC